MPQLYVETDYDDLKIKWGHFYTIIGYESVPAVSNFFYTHSYTEQYGEPFTHTGILASRPWNDNWTVYAGSGQRLECFRLQQPREFPGRRDLRKRQLGQPGVCDPTPATRACLTCPASAPFTNRTMYSIVWTRELNSRWTYVFQHDLGVQADTSGFNAAR